MQHPLQLCMIARLLRDHAIAHTRPIEGRVQALAYNSPPSTGTIGS